MTHAPNPLPSYIYLSTLQTLHPLPAPSTIALKNLTFSLPLGPSPWGPSTNPKTRFHQPILLSARLALRNPFSTASTTDSVDDSTVHYGSLAKGILGFIEEVKVKESRSDEGLGDFVEDLVGGLCGNLYGDEVCEGGVNGKKVMKKYLLQAENFREIEISMELRKASLRADCIQYTKRIAFCGRESGDVGSDVYENGKGKVLMSSAVLGIEGMRIPTLIGVNACERLTEQIVVASVWLDPYTCDDRDLYCELEDLVWRTISESSFETLESLTHHIRDRVLHFFLQPNAQRLHLRNSNGEANPPHLRIRLEKPTAVTFADAPVVELVHVFRNADFEEQGRSVPFPLEKGISLQRWIEGV